MSSDELMPHEYAWHMMKLYMLYYKTVVLIYTLVYMHPNHAHTLWSSPVVEKKTMPQHVVEQRAGGVKPNYARVVRSQSSTMCSDASTCMMVTKRCVGSGVAHMARVHAVSIDLV